MTTLRLTLLLLPAIAAVALAQAPSIDSRTFGVIEARSIGPAVTSGRMLHLPGSTVIRAYSISGAPEAESGKRPTAEIPSGRSLMITPSRSAQSPSIRLTPIQSGSAPVSPGCGTASRSEPGSTARPMQGRAGAQGDSRTPNVLPVSPSIRKILQQSMWLRSAISGTTARIAASTRPPTAAPPGSAFSTSIPDWLRRPGDRS